MVDVRAHFSYQSLRDALVAAGFVIVVYAMAFTALAVDGRTVHLSSMILQLGGQVVAAALLAGLLSHPLRSVSRHSARRPFARIDATVSGMSSSDVSSQ